MNINQPADVEAHPVNEAIVRQHLARKTFHKDGSPRFVTRQVGINTFHVYHCQGLENFMKHSTDVELIELPDQNYAGHLQGTPTKTGYNYKFVATSGKTIAALPQDLPQRKLTMEVLHGMMESTGIRADVLRPQWEFEFIVSGSEIQPTLDTIVDDFLSGALDCNEVPGVVGTKIQHDSHDTHMEGLRRDGSMFIRYRQRRYNQGDLVQYDELVSDIQAFVFALAQAMLERNRQKHVGVTKKRLQLAGSVAGVAVMVLLIFFFFYYAPLVT